MDESDQETLRYIQSRLCVDHEDIRKEFDQLLAEYEAALARIDKLERRLGKYEDVHLSFPTEAEIGKYGPAYFLDREAEK